MALMAHFRNLWPLVRKVYSEATFTACILLKWISGHKMLSFISVLKLLLGNNSTQTFYHCSGRHFRAFCFRREPSHVFTPNSFEDSFHLNLGMFCWVFFMLAGNSRNINIVKLNPFQNLRELHNMVSMMPPVPFLGIFFIYVIFGMCPSTSTFNNSWHFSWIKWSGCWQSHDGS